MIYEIFGVDGEGGQGQAFDGLEDEVDPVVLGHPIAQIGRQQKRGGAVGVFEAVRHVAIMDCAHRRRVQRPVNFS